MIYRYWSFESRCDGGPWRPLAFLRFDGPWEDAVTECSKLNRNGGQVRPVRIKV